MSIDDHLGLFKAEWIGDPERLKTLARESRYNDLFTAEIAAWCAEVHAHLRDLEAEVGVELILMGGNAASLRFDAVKQRGSRDNDYLTLASHADIQRLMDAFAERFAALHPLFLPSVYEPKRPAAELDLITHVIPVALRLHHGRASNNTVKVEFHFETDLPPSETLSGSVGPTKQPMLARVPELPYQFVLKLMTLASPPVGIDEDYRQDAVPRQLYDLDLLLAAFTQESQWEKPWSATARCVMRASACTGRPEWLRETPRWDTTAPRAVGGLHRSCQRALEDDPRGPAITAAPGGSPRAVGLARTLPTARHRRAVHRTRGRMEDLAAGACHGRDRSRGQSQALQGRAGRTDRRGREGAAA